MTRKRVFALVFALVAALGAGAALLRPGEPSPRAAAPAEFEAFTDALRTYDTLYLAFGHALPDKQGKYWRYIVYASADGRVVVDFHRYQHDLHWFWNGQRLLEDEGSAPDIPPRAADVEALWGELLVELRTGLANTTIELVKPPEGGSTRPDLIWGKLTLPFDWTNGVDVYVKIWNRTMKPTGIVLDGRSIRAMWGGEPLHIKIDDFSVDVPVPVGTFSMQAADPTCLPSGWYGPDPHADLCVPPHDPGRPWFSRQVDFKKPASYPASAFAKGGRCHVGPDQATTDERCP